MSNKHIWMTASDFVVLRAYLKKKKIRLKFSGSELFIEQKVYLFIYFLFGAGGISWGID